MSEETEKSTSDEEEVLEETTLLSHLIELRNRLLKMATAIVLVFIVLLPWSRKIFAIVSEPLREVLPGNTMIATAVASPLLTPFKLTFFVALFIAMPIVLYQVWAFIAPGLYSKEKHFGMPLLASSIILFYLGKFLLSFIIL